MNEHHALNLRQSLADLWQPLPNILRFQGEGPAGTQMDAELRLPLHPLSVAQTEIHAAELKEAAVMGQILWQYTDFYPTANRAAIASQWSMDYFCLVMPTAIIPVLQLGVVAGVVSDSMKVSLKSARPVALRIDAEAPFVAPTEHGKIYQRFFREHLDPVVRALARAGGLSRKVLWNNVVVVWDSLFTQLYKAGKGSCGHELDHQWLQDAPRYGTGKALRELQRWVDAPAPDLPRQIPLRKHCCLHYQLHAPCQGPNKPSDPPATPMWCESCPKLHRLPLAQQVDYLRQLYLDDD